MGCKFTVAVIAVAATLPIGAWSVSQTRPAFSGSWKTADGAQELLIAQEGTRLTITQRQGRTEQKLAYQVDGTESRNETRTVAGEKWTHVSRARWVGPAVVIVTTTTRESTGRSWEWMSTYFLGLDGELSVATLDGLHDSDQAMGMRTTTFTKR